MKCELCKMLNLVVECKQHPSASNWHALRRKLEVFSDKDAPGHMEAIRPTTECEIHNSPLKFNVDFISVCGYVEEVKRTLVKMVKGEVHPRTRKEFDRQFKGD